MKAHTQSRSAQPGVIFKLGFSRFLLNSGVVSHNTRNTVLRQVRRILLALNIKKIRTINRNIAYILVQPETDTIFFTSIIQFHEVSARHPLFRGLKAQSVLKQLHSWTKFLNFLERLKFLDFSERQTLNSALQHWRKYLAKYVEAPDVSPILDVTLLRLNPEYAKYIGWITDSPEFIINSKIAIKCRDAVLGLISSRFGKRPCEISTLSAWNIVHPVKVGDTYMINSVANHPSKTTAKYGKFQLFVSPKLFKILELYVRHVRHILSKGIPITEEHYLWITSKNTPCDGKVIGDVMNRSLEAGSSGARVSARSVRNTLATMAAIYTKNNLQRNRNWNDLDRGICRGMRHSELIHKQVYVKQSESLYLSRVDSITESIMTGDVPSDKDVERLSDVSLNKAIIPSTEVIVEACPGPSRSRRPIEHHTPEGNMSTYEYIDILYDHSFNCDTIISAQDIRNRLEESPHITKKIKQNLRLQDLSKLSKITAKAHTYRNYLIRNNIKL